MKENKIEKFIINLSNRWDCSPQEAVDRLNSMNESEIKKLIINMTKKFQQGGVVNKVPTMQYTETPVTMPYESLGQNATLKMGTIRDNGNGATVFESNFPAIPSENINTPDNLAYGESVVDRVNRSRDFQNRMRRMRTLKPIDSGIARKEDGGVMDCLRAGGSFPKCKCGNKVEKGAMGIDSVGQKHEYYRPSRMEEIIGILSKKPKYPRQDGNGTYSAEIRHNGDTVTTVTGPYTTFTETRTPKGERFIETSTKDHVTRTYAPNSSSRGFFRKPASKGIVEMFDNIRKRFK